MNVLLTMVTVVIIATAHLWKICKFVVLLNFAENPVSIPVEEDGIVDVFVGDTAVVKFFAAGLPTPQPSDISWFFNRSSDFNWGNFSADKKTMTIPNVQASHAGEYKFRVFLHVFPIKSISSIATTTVNVIGKEALCLGSHFFVSQCNMCAYGSNCCQAYIHTTYMKYFT